MKKYTPLSKDRAMLKKQWERQSNGLDWEKYVERAEADHQNSLK